MQLSRTQAKIFKGATSQRNIQYQVEEVDNVEDEERQVVRRVQKQSTHTAGSKIIVYCQRTD